MLHKISGIALMLTILFILSSFGCSGSGQSVITPEDIPSRESERSSSHASWGVWQFIADPEAGTLDVIPLRTGTIHLNALNFIDTPPGIYLTIESLYFSGNEVEVDIGLRHPFLGLNQFTGFDVKGILISNGSLNGFTDPAINIPGEGDTRLLNPDGLTRWWNPNEFPDDGTIFGYTDGVLGTSYDLAGYTATANGYKYFCDDLDDPDDPLSSIGLAGRGMFSAGQKNVRHFVIKIGNDGLIFNYAVDANWKFPLGDPPYQIPDDFSEEANQPEAYRIEVTETKNTLYHVDNSDFGGDLHLSIDVYDWFGADLHTVSAEWPGLHSQVSTSVPVGGGAGYSTYAIELIECTPDSSGDRDILITVACEEDGYQGIIPGAMLSSYYLHTTRVSGEPTTTDYYIVFSDEGILEEIWAPEWDDISPALCVETDGDIKMAYNTNKVIANDEARSYACKSVDGLTWTDFQTSFMSWGGTLANHGDSTKVVPSTDGNSWRTLHLYHKENEYWSTPFSAATELFPFGIDGAHVTTYITRAPEIIQDALGFVYIMGDGETSYGAGDHVLQFKKSEAPNALTQGPSGAVWSSFPINYIGEGYFSRARSIELAPNGTMYFVYYVDDDTNEIHLAYNTDDTGLDWNIDTIVYDGTGTGTTGAHDPGLDITEDGEFHVTFIRNDTATGMDQLCYVYSSDGINWSIPQIITVMEEPMNDDPICFFRFDELDIRAAVWQAGTHIYVSFITEEYNDWADAVQVDSLLDENVQPDFVVTDDGVMHIAWAAKNGTHYDIHYRNAWLEES